MTINSNKEQILTKILSFKKKLNEIDNKVTLFLSNKTKYQYPGHEYFISQVRQFENLYYSYPDKDIQYLLDNLMESIRIHEKIWRQKFINYENKIKNIFTDQDIKNIYDQYLLKQGSGNLQEKPDFEKFKSNFNKAVQIKSENIASNETIKVSFNKNGQLFLKKEKIENF